MVGHGPRRQFGEKLGRLRHGAQTGLSAELLGCHAFAALVESLPEIAAGREGIHQEMGAIRLEQCVQVPIDSADEHLEQMRAALRAAAHQRD